MIIMKKALITILSSILLIAFTSCGDGGKNDATAEGFSEIEKEIKNKFGDDAYLTNLSVVYNKAIGNIISVTITEDPESLQMEQWNQTQGNWAKTSDVMIELPSDTKATDFMYQLDDKINLSTLGELIEKSKQKLEEEKGLENAKLSIASIIYPDNGDISKAEYSINMQPENGGTTFNFNYKISGELIKMNY